MNKKKICFIAQFPPPIHGLSKAVDTLYHSNIRSEFEIEKVDLTKNKNFLKNLNLIFRSKADLFYFTISQTRGGNLRDLIILNVLRIQKKKCLIHLHGGYYRTLVENEMPVWQKHMNYKAVRQTEGAIVLGESLKWIFKGMLPNEKIFTVPNCVDDEYLLDDKEFEEKIKGADSKDIKHILYLSNFIRTKGYPEVLEMAKLEREHCKSGRKRQFHFDFAGRFFEKKEEEAFWSYVKQYHLEDYITYHGIVEGQRKRDLLKMCDVFVLLTRYPKEGQPISILEAMGNGMGIVTTDHAGISDVIKNGVNGIVVKKESQMAVDWIYEQLLSLNIEKTGSKNRSDVLLKYRQDQYLKNMRNIFRFILK